jgi:hypothetical protein
VAGEGYPLTARVFAGPGVTVMPETVPVIVAVTVSVAVMDCVPTVFSFTLASLLVPLSAATKV